jgi:dienelactone hydrolase
MLPTTLVHRSLTLLAVAALATVFGAASSQAASPATAERSVATELPDTPVGRQMSWFIEASTRLPLSDEELREHFTEAFLGLPGSSPAESNDYLRKLIDVDGLRLHGLVQAQPDTLVAIVAGRDAQELALGFVVDRAGLIEFASLAPATVGSDVALPKPSGRAAVGTDVVQLVDRARGGRRLMLTRWYPAASGARTRPLATYASPLMTSVLGLPPVRVHARAGASARRGRLPVVLFSPGGSTPRVYYQALAEDLASHGYLVIAVDHTGEAVVELADGHVALPSAPPKHPIATWSATRLADMRLILRRLNAMPEGPLADRRRIGAMGHSLGGSTAAALMRVEPTVRAGIDLDGTIFGAAAKRGVPGAFMVMTGGDGPDRSIRSLLKHSRGPRLALDVAGFEHGSFSDLPVIMPATPSVGKRPSARDIVLQRAYARAFLDRHLRDRPSRLLDGSSRRFPRVSFEYRGR